MNKKVREKVISSLLIGSMCLYTMPVLANTKEETVYSKLNNNGENYSTIVTTKISNDDNSELIKDISSLLNIKNTNGDETFTQNGDEIVWKANGNKIQYQGDSEKELPISSEIKYELDGKVIEAKDIVGKSGKVKVTIKYTNNELHTVKVNGKTVQMYTPFVVVAGTIIDNTKNKNIEVTEGKILDNGTKTTVIGMAMPGLQESLDISEDKIEIPSSIEISMDADDFEMNNIISYATPKVLEKDDLNMFDNLDEIFNKANILKDSSTQLVDGAKQLNEGSSELQAGTQKVYESVSDIKTKYIKAKSSILGNKQNFENKIIEIVQKEIEKMTPELEKQAEEESKNTIEAHKQELEKAVVDTAVSVSKTTVEQELNKVMSNIEKQGTIIPAEQEKALENAISNDIAKVIANNQSDINTLKTQIVQAIIADVKASSQVAVTGTISKKITEMTSQVATTGVLTAEETQAICTAYNVTPEVAQKIAGKGAQNTLAMVQNQAGSISDATVDAIVASLNKNITTNGIEKCIDEYVQKITASVAKQVGGEKALEQFTTKLEENIIKDLKEEISNDKMLVAYKKGIENKISTSIDSVATETATSIAKKYTQTLANEIATNLVKKQFSEGASTGEIQKEIKKYEALIESKLSWVDEGINTLDDALNQVNNGAKQLSDGAEQLSEGMAKFDQEGIQKIYDYINGDLKDLKERVEALKDLADEYNNFAGIKEGNNGKVSFISAIDSLKKE